MFKLLDKLVEYRPFLDLVLVLFFWVLLAVAAWTKDYENMACAAWWIILLELVQVNDNLKALKEKE